MQDNNIDVFISDAEIEYFELSKPISDQTWDEFVRERKAISLGFSRKFNLNLILSDPTIMSHIDSIAKELCHHTGKEIRQPTKHQLNCLFANLYRQHCIHPEMWTRVSRRNQKPIPIRFNPSGINWKTIARLADALEEINYVVVVKGTFARQRSLGLTRSSRIRATPKLIDLIEKQFDMTPNTIGFHPLAEPIVMRGKLDTNKQKQIIPYIDTPRSKADRKLLTAYNGFIQKQEIMLPQSMNEWKPDLIFTTRIFSNGSWDEGGRLFGGEFQNQPKSERSKILINNQPVSEIDISNCHATMAFAEAGVDWFANHSQDLYQIQQMGYWPREVVKKAFSIVLNVDNETSAIKALVREATREYWSFAYEQVDRPKWYHNLIADLKLAYPEIAPNFFRARGLHYMCKEGEIALLVIKECLQRQIPVLTLHDSYIMPRQYTVPVACIVKNAFKKLVSVNCIVR